MKAERLNMLYEYGIRAELSAQINERLRLHIYGLTDSTSKQARLYAEGRSAESADGYHLFIAQGQTEGRGRLGRSFSSPSGQGVYMSLLIRPEAQANDAVFITVCAAVAVCRAVQRLTDLSPRIKWVNDIYIGERKLCGILTEGKLTERGEALEYAVCGIGINTLPNGYPGLEDIATDLFSECGKELSHSRLAGAITDELIRALGEDRAAVAAEYKARSMLIGRAVRVIRGEASYEAEVVDITEECHLIVKSGGRTERLYTGEVSLKI